MSQPSPVEALAERILEGRAPLAMRQAAARGALPLPRAALARLFVALQGDEDEGVRVSAKASLGGMSSEAVAEILGDPDCTPEVHRYFAPRAARDASLAERLTFHPSVPDEALAILASDGNSTVVDLVLTNEQRLLTNRGLLDRLTTNAALRPDQRGKILDILDRLANDPSAARDDRDDELRVVVDDLGPEEAARLLNVDVGELFAESEILGGEEFERSPDLDVRSAYKRIIKLSPGQKAMLAMKGGREERMILVRDTNKVVALSVLKNPRLTDHDVEEVARLRNVCEEVLRTVGANREWVKRYTVMLSLVKNPRSPQSISVNFVSRLGVKDLKELTRDKNVPELVRRMAKRTFDTRMQKSAPLKKKQ